MDTFLLALRVVVSLAAVLAAIWYLGRRVSGGPRATAARERAKIMNVVSRQSIGAKSSLAVVDLDGRRFFLGVTEHGITVLHSAEVDSAEVDGSEVHSSEVHSTNAPALAGSLLSSATWKRAWATRLGPPA